VKEYINLEKTFLIKKSDKTILDSITNDVINRIKKMDIDGLKRLECYLAYRNNSGEYTKAVMNLLENWFGAFSKVNDFLQVPS